MPIRGLQTRPLDLTVTPRATQRTFNPVAGHVGGCYNYYVALPHSQALH